MHLRFRPSVRNLETTCPMWKGMSRGQAACVSRTCCDLDLCAMMSRWVDQGGSSEGFSDEDEEALGMQTAPPEFYDPAADEKVGPSALDAAPRDLEAVCSTCSV